MMGFTSFNPSYRLDRSHCSAKVATLHKPGKLRMTKADKFATAIFVTSAMLLYATPNAHAASCGNGPGGFEAWKQQFSSEARGKGIGANGISALMGASYAQATINADRGQRSFRLSLDAFLAKRG